MGLKRHTGQEGLGAETPVSGWPLDPGLPRAGFGGAAGYARFKGPLNYPLTKLYPSYKCGEGALGPILFK